MDASKNVKEILIPLSDKVIENILCGVWISEPIICLPSTGILRFMCSLRAQS